MSKYGENLINNVSRLDKIVDEKARLVELATLIVERKSQSATIALLRKLLEFSKDSNYTDEERDIIKTVKNSLVEFYGYTSIEELCRQPRDSVDDNKTLEDLLAELNGLVGLESVKKKVNDLIAYQKIQRLRSQNNLQLPNNTLHLAFTGNPGTGKTTVARIVGQIYKHLGLLSKGHFIEVSRTDLIAGYQGQTALKVRDVIEKAKGGVLFIDEAYSITENEHSDSYGRECLTELTKALEDYRRDLVVIVAGYTKPMEVFFNSNLGLKSRFNTFIEFDNYNFNELGDILYSMCEKNDYIIDELANNIIREYFKIVTNQRNENFSNGRFVRNIFDDLVMNHAKRVVLIENPSREELSTIKSDDVAFLIPELQE